MKMSDSLYYNIVHASPEERSQIIDDVAPTNELYVQLIDDIFRNVFLNRHDAEQLDSIFPDMNDRQKIYRDILLTDWRDTYIDNEWLVNRALDAGLEQPDYLMYDLANRAGHRDIYLPSDTDIDSYSINLLWINSSAQDRTANISEQIFDEGVSNTVLDTFLDKLSEWRCLNPDAVINLWSDSGLVTDYAYSNTANMLRDMNVNLRDIRSMNTIPELILISLNPVTPVYYRVDMAKILITDYLLYNEDIRYVVVTDVDVEPMNVDKLFDTVTLQRLDYSGYVFTNSGLNSTFENSFFIFDAAHPTVADTHRELMVDRVESDFQRRDPFFVRRRYDSHTLFNMYRDFRNSMNELSSDVQVPPRKPVNVPPSRFDISQQEEDYESDSEDEDELALTQFSFFTTRQGRPVIKIFRP